MSDLSSSHGSRWRTLQHQRSFAFVFVTGTVLASALTGCGTNNDTKKRLAGLQDQLTIVQNANDRLEERVAALELASSRRKTPTPEAAAAEPGLLARPQLRVVKVDPAASSDAPEPAASADPPADTAAQPPADPPDEARPLIRGSGDKLETRLSAAPAKPTSRAKPAAVGQNH